LHVSSCLRIASWTIHRIYTCMHLPYSLLYRIRSGLRSVAFQGNARRCCACLNPHETCSEVPMEVSKPLAFVLNTKISHISYPSWRAFLGSRLVAICNQHPFNCERAKVGINAVPSACISCSTSSAQSQKSGRMLQQMQKTAANFRSGSTAGVRAPVLPSPKLRQRFHTSRYVGGFCLCRSLLMQYGQDL